MVYSFRPDRRGTRHGGRGCLYAYGCELREKGKRHAMPCHHNLNEYLVTYLTAPACAVTLKGHGSARSAAAPVS
jgi:hypothetical protein